MATDQEIALTRSVVGSDDDAEQTRSARLPSWRTGKAALGVGVAVLLLGTVASFIQGGVASGADAMDSMIQSRAVAEHGRVLTEDELVQVRGLVEKTPNHLRKLVATTPPSVSAECQTAMTKQMTESNTNLLRIILDSFFRCSAMWGRMPTLWEFQMCTVAQGNIQTFDEDQKAACKASNNYCEVIQKKGQKSTTNDMCVPTECHAYEDLFKSASTTFVQFSCSQCSVEVTCGGD
jgi:hypothetical protein